MGLRIEFRSLGESGGRAGQGYNQPTEPDLGGRADRMGEEEAESEI